MCAMLKPIKTVAIIGVGLIGGSVGLALRARNMAERVIGVGRRQESLRIARRVGAVHNTTVDIDKGVAEADFVIVCTPVGRIVDDVLAVAKNCPEGTLITDAGSTKQKLVEALDKELPRGCRFVGSHPLAGSEKAGAAHAQADLFEGRVTVITPTVNSRAEDFDFVEKFWEALGSVTIRLSPDEHDRALAMTSHLPHLAASALAAVLPERFFRLSGTGLLDTTRIAAGDPELWVQIFLENKDNLLASLEQFGSTLSAFHTALRASDQTEIFRLLTLAKKNRDALGS